MGSRKHKECGGVVILDNKRRGRKVYKCIRCNKITHIGYERKRNENQ